MTINNINEELNLINAAIEAILGGAQSYTINGQSVTRANLNDLFKRKDLLQSRLEAKSHRGFIKKPIFY